MQRRKKMGRQTKQQNSKFSIRRLKYIQNEKYEDHSRQLLLDLRKARIGQKLGESGKESCQKC